ncbi:MAG: formate-dependent phosphoribosylglycinamide formyltransferase [Pseudobdellovibrionaceae bacterium]
MKKIMLLGAGELGKEFVISAKRLGQWVVAVDRYEGAPAMQVADAFEVIDMLDGAAIERVVKKHHPDMIVPEIEAIRTEKLIELEKKGTLVIPTAEAAHLTMNRDAIRDVAAKELKLKTANYAYASSAEELQAAVDRIGFPCVVKPVMSSSGKGQSVVKTSKQVMTAWDYACEGMRGDKKKVIVESFIPFDFEITLLTVKQREGKTIFVAPIGHRQEHGDYRESWMPAKIKPALLKKAQKMAKKITDRLGGAGIFGVEFFITKDDVYFSELSPRPHDTGMVTLISQDLSEFDLHVRAILGLPIPDIKYYGPSASAVILATKESGRTPAFSGVEKALELKNVDVRIFGKPSTRPQRRMAVALARAANIEKAKNLAIQAAGKIKVRE